MTLDDAFAMRAVQYLDPGFFTSPALGWIYKVFEEHWDTYGVRMTEVPLRNAVRTLRMDDTTLYAGEVETLLAMPSVPEGDYIRDQLTEWVRMNLFAEAHRESAKIFTAGQSDKAYDVMMRAQELIQSVGFAQPERSWFFDELDDRQGERTRRALDFNQAPRTTGIRDLDARCDGGVHSGEIWAVFAYAKRCKSTWLHNQGFNATRVHRQPTLHIQLEGHLRQTTDRYDACFSKELYTRVKSGELSGKAYAALQAEYADLRKLLVIRRISNWDANVLDIKGELQELKSVGFEPTTLIVDYMDLLRSRNKRVDSELQHQLDAARDLKRLVNETGMACWTAWQAQRPKTGAHVSEHVLTSSNVADAYAKVRIVDAYGSLNATDDEMEEGTMRVFWEGHRDAPVGRLYRIKNDLRTMRMVEWAEEITAVVPKGVPSGGSGVSAPTQKSFGIV